MDLGLQGKRAFITGGTRGIGRAIADHLADDGCDVAICARSQDQVTATVAELGKKGVAATGTAADVTDKEGLTGAIADAAKALGGLDIFVANVSALAPTAGEDDWRQSFEVDVIGTIRGFDAALPHLEASTAGAAVFITSTAAVEIMRGPRPYGAMKAALINHAKGLAKLLAPKGVRVNTVSPGTIYFDGGVWDERRRHQPEVYEWALGQNPTGRMGRPDEVAKAVAFLASPAASFISGTNLIVDGALTDGVQY